jgi:hypothetical protein
MQARHALLFRSWLVIEELVDMHVQVCCLLQEVLEAPHLQVESLCRGYTHASALHCCCRCFRVLDACPSTRPRFQIEFRQACVHVCMCILPAMIVKTTPRSNIELCPSISETMWKVSPFGVPDTSMPSSAICGTEDNKNAPIQMPMQMQTELKT